MEGSFETDQTDSTVESVVARQHARTPAPLQYVTCRVTVPHSYWEHLEKEVFSNYEWYISYPHSGKTKKNEHFHVFLPYGDKASIERLRRALKRFGISGNKCVSIKPMENGVAFAIKYGSREKTQPHFKGDGVSEWIADAPEWSDAKLGEQLNPDKRKREDPNGIMVTPRNFLYLCWEYRSKKYFYCDHWYINHPHPKYADQFKPIHNVAQDCIATDEPDPVLEECREQKLIENSPMTHNCDDLGCCLMYMFDDGYYLDPQFARHGMPEFYLEIFKTSCKAKKLTWKGNRKHWMSKLFHGHNPRW